MPQNCYCNFYVAVRRSILNVWKPDQHIENILCTSSTKTSHLTQLICLCLCCMLISLSRYFAYSPTNFVFVVWYFVLGNLTIPLNSSMSFDLPCPRCSQYHLPTISSPSWIPYEAYWVLFSIYTHCLKCIWEILSILDRLSVLFSFLMIKYWLCH